MSEEMNDGPDFTIKHLVGFVVLVCGGLFLQGAIVELAVNST